MVLNAFFNAFINPVCFSYAEFIQLKQNTILESLFF